MRRKSIMFKSLLVAFALSYDFTSGAAHACNLKFSADSAIADPALMMLKLDEIGEQPHKCPMLSARNAGIHYLVKVKDIEDKKHIQVDIVLQSLSDRSFIVKDFRNTVFKSTSSKNPQVLAFTISSAMTQAINTWDSFDSAIAAFDRKQSKGQSSK